MRGVKGLHVQQDHRASYGTITRDLKQTLDNGDIIGVKGGMKRTDKGELSVAAKSIHMLTKSLLPLPEKYHGFGEDTENRFRNRYVDMIVTEGVRAALRTRAQVSVCMRRVLDEQGFIEVETPMLEASAGGADARPFVTWHNALQRPYVLRIATELRLKRCLVGGFDKVYEIGRIFRNEGLSSRHNPEFTSIELYQAFVDYEAMMDLTEHLVRSCAQAALPDGISSIAYQEHTLDLGSPFRKASMRELVQEATGLDFSSFDKDVEAARAAASGMLEKRAEEVPEGDQQSSVASSRKNVAQASSVGEVLNECFEACVEHTLIQPTFVLDHPIEISPLAKAHRSKPGCVERFELFLAGRELANAFSELTDPVEQRRRLEAQVAAHRRAGRGCSSDDAEPATAAKAGGFGGSQEAPYEVTLDEDFLRALEVGMPPAAGMGLGIDRLVMLLTNASSIKEVIAFPLMR
ncbi:hypothetical protein WJX84_007237 [Apatococcus fuscideae]|uniref:lysine--tRNA ligase n=1 Tax=Apatococcus fuscideae TaxID=2026836 RepID=A0AAW1RRC7_9CHLO